MKMLTILGTTAYVPCMYEATVGQQRFRSSMTRYFQRALVELLPHLHDEPLDTVVVFLTEQARRKNWEGNAQENRTGLEAELTELAKNQNFRIQTVDIPEGHNENEQWEIFAKIVDSITDGDSIVFDITHGYRYIPLLAVILSQYVRIVKRDVQIKGIYYGNLEAIGGVQGLKRLEESGKEPVAPITDLSTFVALQDWMARIHLFLETGRSEPLINQALQNDYLRLLNSGQENALNTAMDSLHSLMQALYNSNAIKIREYTAKTEQALQNLHEEISRFPPPYKPLDLSLVRLNEEIASIVRDDWVETALNAIRWCREKRLYQQAYTMARELLVDLLYAYLNKRIDPPNKAAQTYVLRDQLAWLAGRLYDRRKTDQDVVNDALREWARRNRDEGLSRAQSLTFSITVEDVGFLRSKGRELLHVYAERERGIRDIRNMLNHASDGIVGRDVLETRLDIFERAAKAFWAKVREQVSQPKAVR